MDALIEWGYSVIQLWQSFRHPLGDLLFKGLSFLGEEEAYLLLVPLFYWLLDKRLATQFSILFLLSVYFNYLFKELAAQPRPSPERVVVLDDLSSGGLPSGHAQNAMVSWGFLAHENTHRAFRVAMVALIVGIGLSRIYLGVHFPHDVLAGWLLGALLLTLSFFLTPRLGAWMTVQPLAVQMAAGAGVTLLLMLLYHTPDVLGALATLLGLALGVPLERSRVAFRVPWQHARQAVGRAVIGLVIALLIWRGLRPLLLPLAEAGTILRYSLLGLWVSAGAPWLFVRSGLAEREVPA